MSTRKPEKRSLAERVKLLETRTNQLLERCQEVAGAAIKALEDRDHAERWDETYNAALTGLLAKDACSGCTNREFDRAARVFADQRHGPLTANTERKAT